MKKLYFLSLAAAVAVLSACSRGKQPVDYVNPYMGNISHLLVPTYPTVHLPNSMLRVYPVREDHTTDFLKGLPLIVPDHRKGSVLNFIPYTGDDTDISLNMRLSYDNETVSPYRYGVLLDREEVKVDFAPSHKGAIYSLKNESGRCMSLIFRAVKGKVRLEDNAVSGYQDLSDDGDRVYFYMEMDRTPEGSDLFSKDGLIRNVREAGRGQALLVRAGYGNVRLRYAISFISTEQAERNLESDVPGYDIDALADYGRDVWNEALGRISVKSDDDDVKTVFYTSLYRVYERPVCISEDGMYYSAFDKKVHPDGGRPFYVDDWLWDTYRAAHPLRLLIDEKKEADMLHSYIRMTDNMPEGERWLPTFPKITGDSRGMNCNHGIISIYDAWVKGCRDFDLSKAYRASKGSLEEKTLIPWSGAHAGELDVFYKENGYFPALGPGEKETVPNVGPFEKRQPVAVTMGTSYDHWALSGMARELGLEDDADRYLGMALNYRNLFNPDTKFFHPKDSEGRFIPDLDYSTGGGPGGREYYDENNAYTYRWDVAHNVHDLIALYGGNGAFCQALDELFTTGLGMGKLKFYSIFGGNQTGNIGQFSMGNEPNFHIPYLYIYAGQPWKTQKRIRNVLDMWFRNDLMGVPGDEDGGGMSAFVVFSQLGFYPVTPGTPVYCIGSPSVEKSVVHLTNGKTFTVKAANFSKENKYIRSAKLNGAEYGHAWLLHSDIMHGGTLELEMSDTPNEEWGTVPPPPYFNIHKSE